MGWRIYLNGEIDAKEIVIGERRIKLYYDKDRNPFFVLRKLEDTVPEQIRHLVSRCYLIVRLPDGTKHGNQYSIMDTIASVKARFLEVYAKSQEEAREAYQKIKEESPKPKDLTRQALENLGDIILS